MGKRIAVTGGIGSGKSTVMELLKKCGYPVFSCDAIYKELLLDKAYIQKVQALFPLAVTDGKIDTVSLSKIVFNNEKEREKLNALAHPLIMQKLYAEMDNCTNDLVFAEVPLLFEGGYENDFDGVIVVMRNKHARIESICLRDGISESEALQKIAAQYDYDEYLRKPQEKNTYILFNSSLEKLNIQLNEILKTLNVKQ